MDDRHWLYIYIWQNTHTVLSCFVSFCCFVVQLLVDACGYPAGLPHCVSNGLVPSGNKPIHEPVLTMKTDANGITRPQRVKSTRAPVCPLLSTGSRYSNRGITCCETPKPRLPEMLFFWPKLSWYNEYGALLSAGGHMINGDLQIVIVYVDEQYNPQTTTVRLADFFITFSKKGMSLKPYRISIEEINATMTFLHKKTLSQPLTHCEESPPLSPSSRNVLWCFRCWYRKRAAENTVELPLLSITITDNHLTEWMNILTQTELRQLEKIMEHKINQISI